VSEAKALPLISIIDSSSLWDWEWIQMHYLSASRGTWWLCFAADFVCFSWCLPPPRRLGAARIIERRKVLVSGSDCGDCEGFLSFPRRRAKRYSSELLVACVIPILCWLCDTRLRLDVWYLLAREPPSGWITTMETSLPASKWILVKNYCVILSPRISLVSLWLIDCLFPQRYNLTTSLLYLLC
jgi:hypothetical protein